MKDRLLGPIMVILAGICWGVISIFVRRLTGSGLNSFQIMFFRAVTSVLFLAIFFLFKDKKLFKISIKDIWMFIGTGILSLTFFSFCYFTTIVRTGAAIAVVLLYTSPIFVMIMSAIFFKEKITLKKLIALGITFIGCTLTAGFLGGSEKLSTGSLLIGLGAGFGYALYSIFAGFALKKYSSLTITFYTFVFSGISLPFFVDLKELADATSGNMFIWIAGIALICTVIPYVAYTFGMGKMEKSKAAVLVTVEPLVGTILGILAYKENAGVDRIVGIAMIFVAVILLVMPGKINSAD